MLARAIDHMPLGQIDELTVANVGMVSGGQSANIVPPEATLVGQARGLDQAALDRQIAASGLSGRIELAGAMASVAGEYSGADFFVLASRYEGYGMVFAEALAHGLPIVFCAEGAPRDLIPSEAGRRFEPGDVDGLASALRELLVDEAAHGRAARAALAAGKALPGWDDTARTVAGVLSRLEAPR